MALVKRPGSAESRLETHEPSLAAEPQHVIDLSTIGAAAMAATKASKTGTYKVGDDFYHFVEGDDLPEGATFFAAPVDENEEERAKGSAPQNKAKSAAPENR
jgi:hypothetical protein